MTHPLTPQQLNVLATAPQPGNVAITAVAGSGKTYIEKLWALLCKSTGLATSFNRGTVDELGKQMPAKFPSKTMHSLGLTAIKRSGTFTQLDKGKIYNITRDLIAESSSDWTLQSPVMKLVSLAKTFGIIPATELRNGLIPDTPETWQELADQFGIDEFNDEILHLSREVLAQSNIAALKNGIIDFDDMLYVACLYPHRFTRFPTIIVDEAQDLNALQHNLISKLLLPGGRIIAAGDPNQSIYAFRGALHDSFGALISKFNMREVDLTWSFRCPKAVVREAQRYVPRIESAPNAIEGSVTHVDELSINSLPNTILCRNNKQLSTLGFKLLLSGKTVEIAGHDIGKGLINLTRRITKRNLKTSTFIERVNKWSEREIAKRPKATPTIEDKRDTLVFLSQNFTDLEEVQSHLERMYPNPQAKNYRVPEYHLSTIHRGKGKEWPNVLFLDPQLLPSKYAKQPHELKQESNLAYVGVTRSQENLTYCASDNIY